MRGKATETVFAIAPAFKPKVTCKPMHLHLHRLFTFFDPMFDANSTLDHGQQEIGKEFPELDFLLVDVYR